MRSQVHRVSAGSWPAESNHAAIGVGAKDRWTRAEAADEPASDSPSLMRPNLRTAHPVVMAPIGGASDRRLDDELGRIESVACDGDPVGSTTFAVSWPRVREHADQRLGDGHYL
jgi:hypothetical protein